MRRQLVLSSALASAVAFVAVSCGGSSSKSAPPTTAPPATTTTTTSAPTTTSSVTTTAVSPPADALQAEATATAAGDIPDNQIFLTFKNARAGYSMKYPEGWAQQGASRHVVFRDKNNIVRVIVGSGHIATPSSVRSELANSGIKIRSAPQAITLAGKPAVKVTYTSLSAPNAVTGKRVLLVVDRYYLSKSGTRAVVDLGTPEGVDNVDAYRLMIESFRWS